MHIHIYKLRAIPTHFLSVGSVIFHTVEGSGALREEEREGQGDEDKHVLRALLCLILYLLSSLGPSKNGVIKGPNHWGTLFSASLNMLYHSRDPYKLPLPLVHTAPARGS